MIDWLPRWVARIPVSVHAKLLVAFLAIVLLLVIVAGVGLAALSAANRRTEDLVTLERKIAVYRQLQRDTTSQLHSIASALLVPEERTLQATLRQLTEFNYDVDRLQFVARDNVDLLAQAREDYERFLEVVADVVALIREGKVSDARELQLRQTGPLADSMERTMNELVNRAESDIVEGIEASQQAFLVSRWTIIGFAVGSVGLALLLGYGISLSLIDPVKRMNARLQQIAAGDFSRRVQVENRDELGTLAANLNYMNDEVLRLYEQLEAVNRHKSEFLSAMSHELRTPLNAVIGFSEALQARLFGELNAKQAEYVEDIHASGHHLLSLINDILDLSKIEAGRMELDLSTFDVATAVEQALTFVRDRAERAGVELDVEVSPDLGSYTGDERKFRQILLNLLSNAIKFTPSGGRVGLSASRANGALQVTVSDTGVGIAAEDQTHLFEPFHRVGDRKQEGTGLGLTLTRKFVELHGGSLAVSSAPDRGSTFTFLLPLPT
jgi:signal transduction histidine kinase